MAVCLYVVFLGVLSVRRARLLRCVVQSNVSDVLPDGTVSSMPWRKTGVKYSQNEVYLDIVEEVDAILGVNGQVCV